MHRRSFRTPPLPPRSRTSSRLRSPATASSSRTRSGRSRAPSSSGLSPPTATTCPSTYKVRSRPSPCTSIPSAGNSRTACKRRSRAGRRPRSRPARSWPSGMSALATFSASISSTSSTRRTAAPRTHRWPSWASGPRTSRRRASPLRCAASRPSSSSATRA